MEHPVCSAVGAGAGRRMHGSSARRGRGAPGGDRRGERLHRAGGAGGAGWRFRKAQLDVRAKVLSAYADYALSAELLRLERANAQLLETTALVVEAKNRAGAGGGQHDLLKARTELDLSRNDIAAMEA